MIQMTPALAAQIDETERLAKPRGDSMQVSRDVGELLAALALTLNAKKIVEVGTSYGFSGLWWSAALAHTGGHLHTIDILEKKYATARAAFAAAGVSDRVTSYLGKGVDLVDTIDGPIDLVFIDADKPASQAYFDALWPKVRVGGGVLTDNVLSHKDEMADYVQKQRDRTDAHSVTIPIRAGMQWTVKSRKSTNTETR